MAKTKVDKVLKSTGYDLDKENLEKVKPWRKKNKKGSKTVKNVLGTARRKNKKLY